MMKKNSGGKRFVYKAQKRINNRSQQVVHLNKKKDEPESSSASSSLQPKEDDSKNDDEEDYTKVSFYLKVGKYMIYVNTNRINNFIYIYGMFRFIGFIS